MKPKYLLLLLIIPAVMVLSGCSGDNATTSSGNQEQNHTETNQQTLLKNQPPPTLTWSLERDNIIKRENLWNDPNKISYIYLVSYGKVMAFYTIKGKVSAADSQLTNTDQLTTKCVNADGTYADTINGGDCPFGANRVDGSVPSPSEDGSYGTNGSSIYFFTTDGVYVEWQGDYMLVDQPLQLSTPPEMVRNINN